MQIVTSWNQLQSELTSVEHNVYSSYTNFIVSEDLFKIFVSLGQVTIHRSNNCLWIMRQDGENLHLYFSCQNCELLSKDFPGIQKLIKTGTVVRIIGRSEDILLKSNLLEGLGFARYSDFIRLQCLHFPSEIFPCLEVIQQAIPGDIVGIKKLFDMCYNPVDDEIPGIKELEYYIENARVKVIKHEGFIEACLITMDVGKISHFLYVAVDKDQRGRKLASGLMCDYLTELKTNNITRSLLWVNDANSVAKAYYSRFHFEPDGLKKQIYTWKVN